MCACLLRAHTGVYRQRSERDIRHLPSLSTYCLETSSVTEPEVTGNWASWLGSPWDLSVSSSPPTLELEACKDMPGIFVSAGNSNSDPPAFCACLIHGSISPAPFTTWVSLEAGFSCIVQAGLDSPSRPSWL